jgi:glucokinase
MDEKWLVGVDIGGTTIKLGIVDQYDQIIHQWAINTNLNERGRHIPTEIATSIHQTLKEIGQTKDKILGIGVGAPGPVNLKNGSVDTAVNLGWENFPLVKYMEQETSLPVVAENDANVAAIGEMWRGAGCGAKDLICVTLGTGVGGALIVDSEIVRGVSGAAGEIGHIVSIVDGGRFCNCGKTGCLETVASAPGIVHLALEVLSQTTMPSKLRMFNDENQILSSKVIFEAAKAGDEVAQKVLDQVTFYLGLALANLANGLNPEKIVIGGGVSKIGDTLLTPLKTQFNRFAFPRVAQDVELVIASLGNDAGVLGAAWLAKKNLSQQSPSHFLQTLED